MYTIKQAAARSGVPEALLRAWERRYGVVTPGRTASGYRLYDDEAIGRLRAMRALVDSGWAAAQAAEAVIAGTVEAETADPGPPGPGPGDAADSLIDAARSYDLDALEAAIDELLARGTYEAVVDDRLLPAVAELGAAWADGRIDVAGEHLASAAVQRRLAVLFDNAARAGAGRPVAVGLPPGCRHEIGTLAFGVALRRRGIEVLYLGPDTPVSSWVHVVRETGALAAVIGVPRRADIGPAKEVAAELLRARPDLLVAMGGAASAGAAEGLARLLPPRVVAAAAVVASLLPT